VNYFKRVLFFGSIVLLFFYCDKDNSVKPQNSAPVLKNLSLPDTVFTQIEAKNILTVECEDPDGRNDLDSVFYRILKYDGRFYRSGLLFDDGDYDAHGDITPNNGKYSAILSQNFPAGFYRVVVQAKDRSGDLSNTLEAEFYATVGFVNAAPIVQEYFISDSVYVDQEAPFMIQVTATDPDSDDYVDRVVYQIISPLFDEVMEEKELFDDGTHGDSVAGDNIFSITTSSAFALWKFGNYHLYVQAYDKHNRSSMSLYKLIPWTKMEIGNPPTVANVIAPDTVKLPADTSYAISFLITVEANDPDHVNDIQEVFFNTYKPDGTLSDASPLQMYDNGTMGDENANDQVYSLRVFLVYQNTPGDYRFEFQAIDYSSLLSNKITHIITVIR